MTEQGKPRRAPKLDGRLSAAMRLAEGARRFADVGADHGRLSAVMLMESAEYGLVSDISAAALSKARRRLTALGLAERVTFAVADGLEALAQADVAVECVFLLGMGGETLSGILRRGQALLQGAVLVLGAQTELPLLRRAVCEIGYRIRDEVIASEAGRDYILMRATPAKPGEPPCTEEEEWLGPVLMRTLPQAWLPILERRKRLLTQGVEAMRAAELSKDAERLERFERELVCVNRCLMRLLEGKGTP